MKMPLDSGVSGDVRSERVHGYRPLPRLSEHLRDCGSQISFFRPVSTLMACISCEMVQSEFNGDRNYFRRCSETAAAESTNASNLGSDL
jgi:hypothetical protein